MKIPFRQGIVQHQTDTNYNQTFLQASGSAVTLNVSPTPTIIAFAHKDTNYLYTEGLTVPNAWAGPFTPGVNYWLYWDLNPITGLRTFGHTALLPIVSGTKPISPVVGQHWFDTVEHCMKVWTGMIWNIVIRVFAAKYVSATTFQRMGDQTVLFTGTQVNDRTVSNPGALVFDTFGRPLKTSGGTWFTATTGAAVAGLASAVNFASILVDGQAQVPIPRYSFVNFSDFDKIVLADPRTPDVKPYGMVEIDLVQGMITQVITNGVVVNPIWNWSTVNQKVYIGSDGTATTTPVFGGQTSVGYVIGRNAIVLHQSIVMGIQGPTGPQGPAGPTGPQGPAGADGSGGGGCTSVFVTPTDPPAPSGPAIISLTNPMNTRIRGVVVVENAKVDGSVTVVVTPSSGGIDEPPVTIGSTVADGNGIAYIPDIDLWQFAGKDTAWAITHNWIDNTVHTTILNRFVSDYGQEIPQS